MTRIKLTGLVFALVMLITPLASAEIIISNLGSGNGTQTVFGTGTTTDFKAAGWVMGAESRKFSHAIVDLDFRGDTGQGVWQLWSGAGAPSTAEVTLNFVGPQVGVGEFRLEAPSDFIMNAGETYWLHASASDSTPVFEWNAGVIAPSGSVASAGYNFNGSSSSFQNLYSISAVPEPGSLALLGVAGLGLIIRRRRA